MIPATQNRQDQVLRPPVWNPYTRVKETSNRVKSVLGGGIRWVHERERERETETDTRERELLKKNETRFFMEWARLEIEARQSRLNHTELFSMTFRETESLCVGQQKWSMNERLWRMGREGILRHTWRLFLHIKCYTAQILAKNTRCSGETDVRRGLGVGGVLFAALGSSLVLECGTRSLQDEGWCTSLGFTDVSLLFGWSALACTSVRPRMVHMIRARPHSCSVCLSALRISFLRPTCLNSLRALQ